MQTIDYMETQATLEKEIPLEVLENKEATYLIQYVDKHAHVVKVLWSALDVALKKQLPNVYAPEYYVNYDVPRFLHVAKNALFVVDPSKLSIAIAISVFNGDRAANLYDYHGELGSFIAADPETRLYERYRILPHTNGKTVTETRKFDYWDWKQFSVIISFKPTDIDKLLKKNGILINL